MPVTDLVFKNVVYANFKTLLETTLAGLLYRTLTESGEYIDPSLAPTSIVDGCYMLYFKGIPSMSFDINSYDLLNEDVTLRIGFEVSPRDSNRTAYLQMVNDIETICKYRMDVPSWDNVFTGLQLLGVPEPTMSRDETFYYADLKFRVSLRFPSTHRVGS